MDAIAVSVRPEEPEPSEDPDPADPEGPGLPEDPDPERLTLALAVLPADDPLPLLVPVLAARFVEDPAFADPLLVRVAETLAAFDMVLEELPLEPVLAWAVSVREPPPELATELVFEPVCAATGSGVASPEDPALSPASMTIGAGPDPPPEEPPPQPTLAARIAQPANTFMDVRIVFTMKDAHEWMG